MLSGIYSLWLYIYLKVCVKKRCLRILKIVIWSNLGTRCIFYKKEKKMKMKVIVLGSIRLFGSCRDCLCLYCKRWYFRGINFSRLAAQKHIRGLLNSRSGDAHLSFLYCTKLKSFNEWYNYKYVYNWAARKQADLRQTWVYYPFASTHMVNTQLLRVQNVHTKYRKYFRGFLNSRLLKNREIREN